MSGDETNSRTEISYGSTNAEKDEEEGPPLSFADLGIPTGPQLETTVLGKVRAKTALRSTHVQLNNTHTCNIIC